MATPVQTLPRLASEYSAAQRRQIDAAIAEISARWRRMGPRFDSSWMVIQAAIVSILRDAQADMVDRADAYIPAVLEDTDQRHAIAPIATPQTQQLVGLTGSGSEIGGTLSTVTIRAKQAVEAGQPPSAALITAGRWLAGTVGTILADTGRGAESLNMYSRSNGGYIRVVNGGACGRCVVMAGKWFRKNQGFLRHPRCRCVHVPASEALGAHWQSDPDEYFASLTDDQQIKLMGSKANAQAVCDGADIRQVVNAYRRTAGMQYAQESPIKKIGGYKFTTEGTTRQGLAGQQQMALRRHGPQQLRAMPETIYRRARSQEDALRLLKLNGWIRDDAAAAAGRDIFREMRRVERAERARRAS